MASLRASLDVSYMRMVNSLSPSHLALRSTGAVFEGLPIALYAIAVFVGGLALATVIKWCIQKIFIGNAAFGGHRVYTGMALSTLVRRMQDGKKEATQRMVPQYKRERRGRTKDVVHLATLFAYYFIIVCSIYLAFQVCGLDLSILVGLGAVSILLNCGLAPVIQDAFAAISVFSGGILQEGDDIYVNATGKAMRVYCMKLRYFIGEQMDDAGNLQEHVVSYRLLLQNSHIRFVNDGARHTMGKLYTDWLQTHPDGEVESSDHSSNTVVEAISRAIDLGQNMTPGAHDDYPSSWILGSDIKEL